MNNLTETGVYRGPRETIYETSSKGLTCIVPPALDVPAIDIADTFGSIARKSAPILPEVTEVQIMRHYSHLASMNFGIDSGMYPLGSCTMKYNPRINEDMARLSGFAGLHPYQPQSSVQGALQLMYELQKDFGTISGFPAVTLQPAAGAHGEYTALSVFRAAHTAKGNPRKKVIIPDTAHGTNPASVAMCGYEVVSIQSTESGMVDIEKLKAALDEDTAAFMLTNPNTVGMFDSQILEITQAVHAVGAYAYCDGANLNAILGITRPGDVGFDALHINTHKTFSTPHGGGGPGAGPVCVSAELASFLPGPIVEKEGESYRLVTPSNSLGRVRSFMGNFGVLVRAYTYIKALGGQGIRDTGEQAVLSANYMRVKLADVFDIAYDRICMHEFVISGSRQGHDYGVHTLDMAKRLLDYGFHPPTIYFPQLVDEAMMIEPTETESKESLDSFIEAMHKIAAEAKNDPDLVKGSPYFTPIRRLDEAEAARRPNVAWTGSID
ncbi:MAG: aminomethyl-transferring glycine dehydrogenase subunit GcvPB [Coriobacteriia bacterium]|nr:aminomethyl-transferring glycine dehydrogenase subunit GcvPB [Coriobacteriia bacterium]